MTPEDLQACCAKWQKRLRLQDWHIEVSYRRSFEITEHAEGSVDYNLQHKWAKVAVLAPQDDWANRIVPRDEEFTLVHELVHLHFAPLGDLDHTPEEQAINALTEAILGRKRGEMAP